MFGKDVWSVGEYRWGHKDQTFSRYPALYPKTHIAKVENVCLNIDRILMMNTTKVHCRIIFFPDQTRQFNYMAIMDDRIHVYYSDSPKPEIIILPQTSQDFVSFVGKGGRIEVENNPGKKILNYNLRNGCWNFIAEGNQVYVEGYGKRKSVLQFEKTIDAIFYDMVVFQDGTVKRIDPSLYQGDYINQLLQQISEEYQNSVKQYREEVMKFDQSKMTADGCNVKQILVNIGNFIYSNPDHGNYENISNKIQALETLTHMIRQSNDPGSKLQIQRTMADIQYKVSAGKDIFCGVLLLIAAGALIGLGVLCVSVLLVPTCAASTLGVLLFPAAATLIWLAAVKLHSGRKGIEYNHNIKKVTDFFAKPSTTDQENKVNESVDKPMSAFTRAFL